MAAALRLLRTAAIAIAASFSLAIVTPSLASAATPTPLQFGAFTPGDPYSSNVNGTDALQASIIRHVDIVNWYQNWGGGDWISSVQPSLLAAVSNSGRTPLLTWEPWAPGQGPNQPKYALSKIVQGNFDPYIRGWADALRASGKTVFLRPMHEMNGNWYPWAGTVNGNTPARFVAAWRRMHDIFTQRGATNVRWVWSPNNVDVPGTAANKMEAYYPGAAYVDVLAVDGYNWGSTAPQNGGWKSFSQVFSNAYSRLSSLGSQPIWIAEVGSAPEGGDKAAWVRDMFAKAQSMTRLKAIVWFNENKERDWRAAPNATVAAAFRPDAGTGTGTGTDTTTGGTTSRPKLKLSAARRTRAGRKATVRWKATRATTVKTWVTMLDGKRVRTVSATRTPVLRKRIARPGKHKWTVVGRDAAGHKVVSATKRFRAYRS
jgi:beta-mannanase